MLVREETKEIEISMDNKIISITRDTKQYTYKRKVYNFNQIQNDDEEKQNSKSIKYANKKAKAIQNYPTEPDAPISKNKSEQNEKKNRLKSQKQMHKFKEVNFHQQKQYESYALLKILTSLLVLLVIMTIFQNYFPNSQYNILRIFNSPIKTSTIELHNTTVTQF